MQLTRLTEDGRKASAETPRRTLGKLKGAVVVIQDRPGGSVIVTDGVEDAIAIASVAHKAHVVATLGVANFANARPHDGRLILFVDNVDADRHAADRAAAKLTAAGIEVSMARPPDGVKDANDLLIKGGPDAIKAAIEARTLWKPPAEVESGMVFDPKAPLATARAFVDKQFTADGVRTLHHHGGQFRAWNGTHFETADGDAMRAGLYGFLDKALAVDRDGPLVPFCPTTTKVNDVIDALKAETNLPRTITEPAWLEPMPDYPASEILACKNGLLHTPSEMLLSLTPLFFSHHALTFAHDADAGDPKQWLDFLDQLWPDDPEAIDTLQQIFGYALTADTRYQKLLMIVGPKRSGKGTIARVLTALVGPANVCAPTLASLSENFGLAPLIDLRLAIISDARLSGRADQHAIAERLLSISGEDALTIDRKHLPAWTGRLSTRFLILTNELPRLADVSGALASRFVVLRLVESFIGREVLDLTDKLLVELPGILNWSLDGLRRLNEAGRFTQPQSSDDAIESLADLASPVGAFVRERCEVGPYLSVDCKELFAEYKVWGEEQGRNRHGNAQTFGRDLRTVIPKVTTIQSRQGKVRVQNFSGVSLIC